MTTETYWPNTRRRSWCRCRDGKGGRFLDSPLGSFHAPRRDGQVQVFGEELVEPAEENLLIIRRQVGPINLLVIC